MFDGPWRAAVDEKTAPVGLWLHRHHVTADVLTGLGLASASGCAVAIAFGAFPLALGLLVLTGLGDLLDGPVARAGGMTSTRGAFFDSVVDRLVDMILMLGVAAYLISHHRGFLVLLPFGIAIVTSLISYQRAKAESLGLEARGGLMERGERLTLLGVSLLSPVIFVPVLWALFVLTAMTALGRFWKVWKAASITVPPRTRRPRGAGFEARWHGRPVETLTTRWKARGGKELISRGTEHKRRRLGVRKPTRG